MDFRIKVLTELMKSQLIRDNDRLLVACSGGADSIALLTFLWHERKILDVEIGCVHANHGLRGSESDADEDFVKELCRELEIPFFYRTLPINELVEKEKGNVQDICRRERYMYFAEVMHENAYNKLVVAHHADDQAETVLMGLTRGSNANGMPIAREFGNGKLIRPFLFVTRQQIEDYLHEQHRSYREDSSNKKDTYTRNRFRHHILPLIAAENTNGTIQISQWAEQRQLEDEFLESLAIKECEKVITAKSNDSIEVDLERFQGIPMALQKRVVLLLLNYLYPKQNMWLGQSLIEQIHDQCLEHDGSKEIALPNGGKVRRQYSMMLFSFPEESSIAKIYSKEVILGEWVSVGYDTHMLLEKKGDITQENEGAWYIVLQEDEMPLTVRTKQIGDRLTLQGMSESKRVSRLMIDEKVPRYQRDLYLLLVTNKDEILGVPAVRLGFRFAIQPPPEWTHRLLVKTEARKPKEEQSC
ncbi:MAG: tRNA lysidine(34) synthetase TilS [Paenisporosarcina sp.]